MKKKLLALSIGAALTAATVPAMSAELKISGRAHLSVDHMDNGASGAEKQSGMDVSSNSSRLRISGNSQVTDGLTALMQIESGITIDDGSGSLASRDTFAGLKGDFGTVRLGMFDTPTKKVRSRTDMFGDRVGDARNITVGGFDNRFKNSVGYTSPNMNGLVFDLQYSANFKNTKDGKKVDLDKNLEAVSASLSYKFGDVTAILANENINQGLAKHTKTDNDSRSATRAGLIYNVNKQVRVTGFYQNTGKHTTYTKDSSADKTNITGSRDVYGVGAYYKMGDYTLRGQYYMAEDLSSKKDTGANMVALGLDRKFGKDLTLYAVYANTSNDKDAKFSAVAGGHDSQVETYNGKDVSAISLGMIYNF